MLYREQLDGIRDRLAYVAAYLKAIDAMRPPMLRRRIEVAPPSALHRRPRPYESLERTVQMLDWVRRFYPSQEEMRRSAFTFAYDAASGTYRMRF